MIGSMGELRYLIVTVTNENNIYIDINVINKPRMSILRLMSPDTFLN
jgi:hypothetical protein